jgi:hypothetical protein
LVIGCSGIVAIPGLAAARRVASKQPAREVGGDSLCRPAIPELRNATRLAGTGENFIDPVADRSRIATDQGIGPCSTVIGRSVFSRIVRQGTPSAVVSSCKPPESDSTSRAPVSRPSISR